MIFQLIFFINFIFQAKSFKINFCEEALGNWNLLYSDNNLFNLDKNKFNINILPVENRIDKLSVKIN